MSHLVVQPASGTTAREHYEDTIARLVPLDSLKPYLKDEEFSALYNTYLAGAAPIWGVTPGTNGVNFRPRGMKTAIRRKTESILERHCQRDASRPKASYANLVGEGKLSPQLGFHSS